MSEENTEDQGESLRDTLEAAIIEHTEAPETPEVAEKIVEAPKTTDETRDEGGRFKPKAEATPVTAKKAPEFWSQARKDKFNTLPADVQDMMLERESEVEKGFTKMDEERNFGKALKEVITPYMATIQAEGGTAPAAVKDLLNTAYVLRTGSAQQKAALIGQVIQQYGVDMRLLGQPQAQAPQQPQINEEAITQKIMTNLQTQQMNDRIATELQAFTADSKNVHFSNPAVKDAMSSLLGSGQAKNYQDAYDQALWLIPEIRPALIAAQTAPVQAQRTQDIAAKKKAGSSVSGSPGISVPNSGNTNRTLREELEANLNAALN